MSTQPPVTDKADCYSAGEREAMLWTQDLRGRLFRPLLASLHTAGITADQITLVSLLAGVSFVPLWIAGQHAWGLTALGAHVLLDGLDGPLARLANTASRRGSFTDTTADQIVVALVTVTLMTTRVIDPVAGGLYIFLYTLVVVFAMIRTALEIPYAWLVRPRFVVYGWLVIETYFGTGSLPVVIWMCNALLTLKLATGFLLLRSRL
jgi:CDP-diacylglycerol--glycerol-3-phosphate 3-phosphatidyltransferase